MGKRKCVPQKEKIKREIDALKEDIKKTESKLYHNSHQLPYRVQMGLLRSIDVKKRQLQLLEQQI